MLEQTSSSYGGLKLGLFLTKWGPFAQFQRAPFGKSSQQDGNETLIFKRFRLFWSRFDSSNCESPSKCFLLSNFDIPAYQLDGNETLIFKRFRLFWSRFDSSDWESPSKCFLLSNFDIPAYHLAGFSKRLSTVTNPVSREPPPPPPFQSFQSQALIKMATVRIFDLVWTF